MTIEQLRTGFLQRLGTIRMPHVLTDHDAKAHAADAIGPVHGPRREDALLVEDAIVRADSCLKRTLATRLPSRSTAAL